MNCEQVRSAVSALIDGEDPGISADLVERHLQRCPACREFRRRATVLRDHARVSPAPAVPDLTSAILHRVHAEQQSTRADSRHRELRICLAAVALLQLVVATPTLVLGTDTGISVHAARHLGSFSVAMAVGLLFVAWRPSLAAGLLPLVAVFAACFIGATFVDVLAGRATAGEELAHLPELVGLVLLVLIAWCSRRQSPAVIAG